MTGGLGPGRAERDLPAVGGAAFDCQERLGDVGPAGVPLHPARLDDVLGFEHKRGFRLEAVVDRLGPWVEVAHQVIHADTHTGCIDTDVLDVETLGELLDLCGLMGERLPSPAVLLQDPELSTRFSRWRDDHAGRIVPGTARVVAQPDWRVAERTFGGRVVIVPEAKVGVGLFEVSQAEHRLGAVDELAHEQLLEAFFVVLQAQAVDIEQIAAAGNGIFQRDDLAPLAIRAQRARVDLRLAGPCPRLLPAFAVAERFTCPEGVRLVGNCTGR